MARLPLTPWQPLDAAVEQPHPVLRHTAETRVAVAWAAAELRCREPLCESPGWTWPVERRAPAPPAWHGIVLAAALTAVVLGLTTWLDARAERQAQAHAAAAAQGAQVTLLASR